MTLSSQYQVFLVNDISNPAVREGQLTDISGGILSEELNQQESFVFTLRGSDPWIPQITIAQSQVQIVRDNTLIWWGIITSMQGGAGSITYAAQDFSWLFTKRYIAPVERKPFYSTRFQLSSGENSRRSATAAFGNSRTASSGWIGGANTSHYFEASENGVSVPDNLWRKGLNGMSEDLWWNSGGSAWNGRAHTGQTTTGSASFGNYPTTVTLSQARTPDTWFVKSSAFTLNPDWDGVDIVAFEDNDYITYVNWSGADGIDVGDAMMGETTNTLLGGRITRRFRYTNSTEYPIQAHAIAYIRLNSSTTRDDPFSSMYSTIYDAKNFSVLTPSTWSVVPPVPAIAKFGLTNDIFAYDSLELNNGWDESGEVAFVDSSGIPSGKWVRLILTITIPPNVTNKNFMFCFQAAGGPGYCIGGLDIVLDDGLFYSNTEQATIISDILSYVQNSSAGWESLNIGTNIETSGKTRSKAYLFSDTQIAYDALWEFTTLLGGYDFGWTYSQNGTTSSKTFNAWYAQPAPGTAVGADLGRGQVKDVHWSYPAEIKTYEVTGDGSMLSDVVGVYEATTDAIYGGARDFAVASNVPSGRWQLATIYEGTPGSDTLTLQSQAQRGYARYSNLAFSLTLTIDPAMTTTLWSTLTIGDVIYITIPNLGVAKTQFRITGRKTNLKDDTVDVTVQQYYGA